MGECRIQARVDIVRMSACDQSVSRSSCIIVYHSLLPSRLESLVALPRIRNKFRKILHLNRLGEVFVDASIIRRVPCFLASDTSQSSNVACAKIIFALERTDLRRRFESIHDLDVNISGADESPKNG